MARRRERSLLHTVIPDRSGEAPLAAAPVPAVVTTPVDDRSPVQAPPPAPVDDPISDAELALLDLAGRAVRGDWASLAATTLQRVSRALDVHERVCGGAPAPTIGPVLDVAGLERRIDAGVLAHEAIRHDLEVVADRLRYEPAARLRDQVAELAHRIGRHRRDVGRSPGG